MRIAALAAGFWLAACQQQPVAQPSFAEDQSAAELALSPKPDSKGAKWTIAADGQTIHFGQPAAAPLLSFKCKIGTAKSPPQLTIVHHAQSEPGAKALFAVLGNGTTSRLKLDAALGKQGWDWEGSYPASAPELDVFTGLREIEATLPGGGTLHIAASNLPRDFIDWCRRNGRDLDKPDPANSPLRG